MARSEHDPVGHHRRAFLDTAELTSQRAEPGRHVLGPEPAELVSLDRDHTSLLVPDGDQRPLRGDELTDQAPVRTQHGDLDPDRQLWRLEGELPGSVRAAAAVVVGHVARLLSTGFLGEPLIPREIRLIPVCAEVAPGSAPGSGRYYRSACRRLRRPGRSSAPGRRTAARAATPGTGCRAAGTIARPASPARSPEPVTRVSAAWARRARTCRHRRPRSRDCPPAAGAGTPAVPWSPATRPPGWDPSGARSAP